MAAYADLEIIDGIAHADGDLQTINALRVNMRKEGWLTLVLRFAGGERRISQPCVLERGVLLLERLPSITSHLKSRLLHEDGALATATESAAAQSGGDSSRYVLSVALKSCRVEDRRDGGGLEHFALLEQDGERELLFRADSDDEAEEWVVALQEASEDGGEAASAAAGGNEGEDAFEAAESISPYPLVAAGERVAKAGAEEDSDEDSDEEDSPFNFGLWQEGDSLAPYQTSDRSDVRRMLRMAGVGPGGGEGRQECVYDLGCGDGRIVIAAVADFGADRAVGVEIDEEIAAKARTAAEAAGVSDRVSIHTGDVLTYRSKGVGEGGGGDERAAGSGASKITDLAGGQDEQPMSPQDALSDATVVVTFLLPAGMKALLRALRGVLERGGRVVSNTWGMGEGLRPVQEEDADNMSFYLYTLESLRSS